MKLKAFTLAEVLVTLGIIGVVAAMTLPSVINTYRKLDTTAKLKKFYSAINQAVNFSVVENGEPIGWIETLVYHNPESLYDWFDRYVMKHMIVLKRCRVIFADSKKRAEVIGESIEKLPYFAREKIFFTGAEQYHMGKQGYQNEN